MVKAKAGAAMSGGAGDRHRVAPIPRQQCGQFGDLVIGDPGEHVGKPGLGIDIIEFGRLCRHPNYAERFWNQPVAPAHLRAVERTSFPCHSA
jgi:hypothetical protein